jgi:hypothetical protein
MREEPDNKKLLVRYLLGDLPEEQRLEVEGMFLGNDQQYEQLLALENELFYDYAQGKLSAGERKQFEKRFLTSEQNRRRAMFASALVNKISEVAPVEGADPGLAKREPQQFWRSLKSYFSLQSPGMRLSFAALTIMLFVLILLVVGIVRQRNESDQIRAEQAVQKDQLQRQVQQERARADELNLKLKREMDENTLLKKEISEMKAQSGRLVEKLASVISFVLAPSQVRDQATGMKKIYIPPGVRLLNLQLNLKGEVENKSYEATLLTVEGAERWSQGLLRAKRTGPGKSLVLWLPARVLIEGDYELRLKGTASDGRFEETGDYYYFSIVRN